MAASALFDEAFIGRLSYLHVVARKLLSGGARGERRARRVGAGLEFADHRDYAPGDDLRTIDWAAYARLDRLLVRLFEEEEDLHVYLLVDASASMAMGSPPKFDHARRIAAALAYIALGGQDRVSVAALGGAGGPGSAMAPVRGRGQIFKLLASLERLSPSGKTDLLAAATALLAMAPRRGLAIVLSDFFDPRGYAAALDLLRHRRFDVAAIQIADAADARPAALGDVALVDCETGARREVTVTPRIASALARAHRAFSDELAAFCADRALPCLRADTDVPFDEVVLRALRKRGFVR